MLWSSLLKHQRSRGVRAQYGKLLAAHALARLSALKVRDNVLELLTALNDDLYAVRVAA